MKDHCDMGVGCDEVGACFADRNGQPDQCGRRHAEIPCDDCEGPGCEICGDSGKRRVGVFDPICARHCDMCDGSDHHWEYYGDDDPEGEPLMTCKHCVALRYMMQDDDANADH